MFMIVSGIKHLRLGGVSCKRNVQDWSIIIKTTTTCTHYEVKSKTFSSYEYGGVVGFVVCNIYSHHDSAPLSLVLL